MANRNRSTATKSTASKPSSESTPKVHKADGETINDETTYVRGHDGEVYTSTAYADSDEAKGIVKDS